MLPTCRQRVLHRREGGRHGLRRPQLEQVIQRVEWLPRLKTGQSPFHRGVREARGPRKLGGHLHLRASRGGKNGPDFKRPAGRYPGRKGDKCRELCNVASRREGRAPVNLRRSFARRGKGRVLRAERVVRDEGRGCKGLRTGEGEGPRLGEKIVGGERKVDGG